MQKSRRKKIMLSALLIAMGIAVLCVGFAAFSIIQFSKEDQKTPCDAAIVLGAAASGEEVSPVYRERINHGIWLCQNGYADYLILTGGVGQGNLRSDAAIAKEYAISMGIPEDVILIEENSTITEENLQYAKCIMQESSLDTAIIVSDPLHMKRAMLMADDYGICAYSSPSPTTMYRSIKTQLPFLAREVFFYVGYAIVRLLR